MKPAIPPVPRPQAPRNQFDAAVKETLEVITGRRGNRLDPQPGTATNAEIIARLNELLDRLQ